MNDKCPNCGSPNKEIRYSDKPISDQMDLSECNLCAHKWHGAESETVGDDEALEVYLDETSDAFLETCGYRPTPIMAEYAADAWKAALSHERATVREAVEAFEYIVVYWNGAPESAVDAIEEAISTAEAFLAAHKPEKETGGEFCEARIDDYNTFRLRCDGELYHTLPDKCPIHGKPIRIKDGSE